MSCCPHCIQYFEGPGDHRCPVCGHPESCGRACVSFTEPAGLEWTARELAQLPANPEARLRLFELYVDPTREDFDHYSLEQRVRVQAAADRLKAEMPQGDSTFAVRLARVYYDVRSQAKGAWLAGLALAGSYPHDDHSAECLDRLGWSCLHTRLDVELAVECYTRLRDYLRRAGRDPLEAVKALARALEAAGKMAEAQAAAAEANRLHAERLRFRRQQFQGALCELREKLQSLAP